MGVRPWRGSVGAGISVRDQVNAKKSPGSGVHQTHNGRSGGQLTPGPSHLVSLHVQHGEERNSVCP